MDRIAVVTGANQGLGFALAAGLANGLKRGDVVYLAGRDSVRVRAAVECIAGPRAEVHSEILDGRDGPAVDTFADEIHVRHGGVDIVFSNAAARLTPGTPWPELVGPFVEINNVGPTGMLLLLSIRPCVREAHAGRGQRLRLVATAAPGPAWAFDTDATNGLVASL